MIEKIRRYKELTQKAEKLKKEIDELKNQLISSMDQIGSDVMYVDVFTLKKTAYTQERFDSAAFRIDHSDLYDSFKKTVSCVRFTVN